MYDVARHQKMVTAREVEAHKTHPAPRGHKQPPPRCGCPPAGARAAAERRHPHLAAPSLAISASDSVDSSTLLSQAAKEQEELEKREEEAKETLRAWKQCRKRVKAEFMALVDRPTLSPHDDEKLR